MKTKSRNLLREPWLYLPIKRLQLSSKQDVLREYLNFFWSEREFANLAELENFCENLLSKKFTNREIFYVNQSYSHDFIFKRYMELPPLEPLNVIIEHGPIFVKYLVENSLTYKAAKGMLTSSPTRKNYLQGLGVKALDVGPYIHYAKSLVFEDTIQRLKTQSGKTALYFPDHSTESVINISAQENFINSLNRIQSEGFDTTIVCVHNLDYCSLKSIFKSHAQTSNTYFMTAGLKYGVHFMSTLFLLITLADKVFTNTLGTHVGYAASLKKDLGILEQTKLKLQGDSKAVANELRASQLPPLDGMKSLELALSDLSAIDQSEKDINKRIENFRNYLEPYFGFNSVKSRSDINEFIASL